MYELVSCYELGTVAAADQRPQDSIGIPVATDAHVQVRIPLPNKADHLMR